MTREEEIKEKAEKFADSLSDGLYFKNGQQHKCREHGFIQGAKWADQHPREGLWDSKKVVEWILNNYPTYEQIYTDNSGSHCYSDFQIGEFIRNLRKAMEE